MLLQKGEDGQNNFMNESSQKMAVKALKYTAKGFSFNERVVYIDSKEIRYYSKISKDFQKNDFTKLTSLPKMGIPVALCELLYPSIEWYLKKKKKNAIRVVFPQGSQMTYQPGERSLLYFNKQNKMIDIFDHIAMVKSVPSRKKLEWVFVFRQPFDLQKFIEIVENVTNPDVPITGNQPQIDNRDRENSLEKRRKDYINRNFGFEAEEKNEHIPNELENEYNKDEQEANDETPESLLEKDTQLIKNKIFKKRM